MDRLDIVGLARRSTADSQGTHAHSRNLGRDTLPGFTPARVYAWRLRPRRGIDAAAMAVLLFVVITTVVSGCSASASRRTAQGGPTPDVRATQTAQAEQRGPVVVQVSAQVQGTIAAQTLALIAQVTVTNHTSQPIHLAGTCPHPPIDLTLIRQGASGLHIPITKRGHCILSDNPFFDLDPAIAPDSAHTWTQTITLCNFGSCWQPGTYVLTAVMAGWHQGTIAQVEANVGVLYGSAQGQTVITLA